MGFLWRVLQVSLRQPLEQECVRIPRLRFGVVASSDSVSVRTGVRGAKRLKFCSAKGVPFGQFIYRDKIAMSA